MKEIWKDIKNYEGLYQVSNLGNIKSIDHYILQNNNGTYINRLYKGKLIKLQKERNGYIKVHLCKKGISKWFSVHRLVAEAFILHNEINNIVNHIDNNPSNNNVNNLEWTTYKGNMQWATKQKRMKYNTDNLKKAQETRKRKVIAIDKNGNEYEFNSQVEASKILNCNRKHIGSICKNKYGYKTTNGYSFKYKE